jgi:hypothetical protein
MIGRPLTPSGISRGALGGARNKSTKSVFEKKPEAMNIVDSSLQMLAGFGQLQSNTSLP